MDKLMMDYRKGSLALVKALAERYILPAIR